MHGFWVVLTVTGHGQERNGENLKFVILMLSIKFIESLECITAYSFMF